MGFLKRALGGDRGPPVDPMLAFAQTPVAGPDGRVYVRSTCPHCDTTLAKLPGRSAKCPTCGQAIVYVRGADDLVYLVRPNEDGIVRAEADAHHAMDNWSRGRNDDALRKYCRAFRGRYAALGVRVWTRHGGDASCADCRALHGRLIDPATAPDLPLRGCRSRYCFCAYVPTLADQAPPASGGPSNTVRITVG